jgi:hypothetical protein
MQQQQQQQNCAIENKEVEILDVRFRDSVVSLFLKVFILDLQFKKFICPNIGKELAPCTSQVA